jgi:hypothetical protein
MKIAGAFFYLSMALEWLVMAKRWPACRTEFARKAGAFLKRWHREINFQRDFAGIA